jgi:1-deoxy-D-xylulose-5-phosphate reductoisomerase
MKQLAILGSTGSIGTQALDVVSEHPDKYEIYALTANDNADLLIRQAQKYMPDTVVIANKNKYPEVKEALEDLPVKVWAGAEAIAQVVTAEPVDMVLTAMVGYAGLKPTIEALKAHKPVALANKETLVVAGELITSLALQYSAPIIPVDSEHSAIFQCINGNSCNSIEKLILTASGGPFFNKTKDELASVTLQQALNHPNWKMGAKVTIDSASLMNKGFEMIEAKWLFGVKPDDIEILIHPQSVIHSMVQYADGSVIAQLSVPDMRLPIAYAFSYPDRLPTNSVKRLDFTTLQALTFAKPDTQRFPNLAFAFEAVKHGGNMPCILNAANEVAVDAFLNERISFLHMSDVLLHTMKRAAFIQHPTYDDYVATDAEARNIATDELKLQA